MERRKFFVIFDSLSVIYRRMISYYWEYRNSCKDGLRLSRVYRRTGEPNVPLKNQKKGGGYSNFIIFSKSFQSIYCMLFTFWSTIKLIFESIDFDDISGMRYITDRFDLSIDDSIFERQSYSAMHGKAKSKTVLPIGNSMTSHCGVYKKICFWRISILRSFLNCSLSSKDL